MQRQIELYLSDAIRAGNTFIVGLVENYLFLDIFAYSDVIEKILTVVKERIFSVVNNSIINNYLIYKDYTLENLLNNDKANIRDILK